MRPEPKISKEQVTLINIQVNSKHLRLILSVKQVAGDNVLKKFESF